MRPSDAGRRSAGGVDGGRWEGVVDGRCIRLRQHGRLLHFSGADEAFVRHYLALDLDLDRLLAAIDRDPVIGAAIESCRGLRVLRQPLFECLLSFLCATNTNIPAVRSRVEAIAGAWGEPATGWRGRPGLSRFHGAPTRDRGRLSQPAASGTVRRTPAPPSRRSAVIRRGRRRSRSSPTTTRGPG